jgi:hypothetical protein
MRRIVSVAVIAAMSVVAGCEKEDATTTAPADADREQPLTAAQIANRSFAAVVQVRTPTGAGSGFVVDASGIVATNLHVIYGAESAEVLLEDDVATPVVEVLGVDEEHDLALLKIEAEDLTVVALGDSDAVEPGDAVVAIGNPLGVLSHTVSDGLISAVRDYEDTKMLQISAPISVGSSGGPVFDERGQVIGVATLIVTGGQNLNFAVPINYLRPLLASPKPETLPELAERLGAGVAAGKPIERKVPVYDASLLDGCPRAQQEVVVREIAEAIEIGAPIYNVGEIDACYRIYEGATRRLRDTLPGCKNLKRALTAGLDRATALSTPDERAWAMRDLFDGLLEAIVGSA